MIQIFVLKNSTVVKSPAVTSAGHRIAVASSLAAMIGADAAAVEAEETPWARLPARAARESRFAHAGAVLRVAFAAVSALMGAGQGAAGAVFSHLARPVTPQSFPPCVLAIEKWSRHKYDNLELFTN